MRKILIPVAAAAVAFSSAAFAQNRGRQRHQRWRRGQVGLGCDRAGEHDGQARHGEKREENDEEKEGVVDTVTALAICRAARRS